MSKIVDESWLYANFSQNNNSGYLNTTTLLITLKESIYNKNKSFDFIKCQIKQQMKMSNFTDFLTSPLPGEEVVVSGISGKYPSCDNVEQFKEKLLNKEDMIEDIIKRWQVENDRLPKRGGTLNNIEKFDPGFFGIHGRQASTMDPMMMVFLETALEAIFDAGLHPSELEGTRTGVYVGTCWADAEYSTLTNISEPQRMGITGVLRSFLSHRLAYFLKLKGPCFIVDTACSSSFNALEVAFKDMRNGKCDKALVGGSNLTLLQGSTIQFFDLGVLSSDGKCKVFDEEADGYVRSETISCILLQKAKDSRRIYAQIIHIKSNCDGFKESGITFPSTEMQSVLMKEVYEESGVHPRDICYLEGHCTATRVGDPQEIEAIDKVLGKNRKEPLLIGSVKSNIGHTEPSSGLCSLTKVLIIMETGIIPPNIHLKTIKKSLTGMEEGRLKPVMEQTPILDEQAIIGINNFGFGGNNCHLILKRLSKKQDLNRIKDNLPRLVCVSGRTEEAVMKIFEDLRNRELNVEFIRLLQEIFKYDIQTHTFRGYAVVSDCKEKSMKISVSLFDHKVQPLRFHFGDFDKCYQAIGRSLLAFNVFKLSLSRFNEELKFHHIDIFDIILKNGKRDCLQDVCGSVGVQIAIGDLLKNIKLEAAVITGNSWGILASLYLQNYMNIKQIIDLIIFMNQNSNVGSDLEVLSEKLGTPQFKAGENEDSFVDLKLTNSDFASFLEVSGNNNRRDNILDTLLEIFGRLYQHGYNPHLQLLYPDIKFPVSRGTPMISPLISWKYSKSWYTPDRLKIIPKTNSKSFQTEITYTRLDHGYIHGHVIDGRNLFPAAGYMEMVWRAMVDMFDLKTKDIRIVFENIQFLSAVSFPKNRFLAFILSMQTSGIFEISQGSSIIVKGNAYITKDNVDCSKLPAKGFKDEELSLVMDKDDIYKELHLRGYNYKGLFQGIVKANLDVTSGLVKWENNWVAFIDNMLQLKILQHNTRNLYVPIKIKKCIINPLKHPVKGNVEIPVTTYKEGNIIKCESVEIYGIEARSIAKKKQTAEPILEKYVFVPNFSTLTIDDCMRVITQLILENCSDPSIKCLELLEDCESEEIEPLLVLVYKTLEGVPLINADFIVSTKRQAAQFKNLPESIKVDKITLTQENNYHLIIASKVLEQASKQAITCLKKNSFLVSREDRNFTIGNLAGVEVLTVHEIGDEKIILLRKIDEVNNYIVINISESFSFEWLPKLQRVLKAEIKSKVLIYSQNQKENGIVGLINCILREKNGARVKCFFILDDEAPEFDPCHEFYLKQIKKNVAINIYKNGKWGTYRHLLLDDIEETDCEHCFVSNTIKGDLSSLKWLQGKLNSSAKNLDRENFVKVHYASLNFKDIMIASGRINADEFFENRVDQGSLLGFEYSGVNLDGKRIMGMLDKEALSTVLKSDPSFAWEIPKHWSLEEAATVPVVYSTVIYGLMIRTRFEPGMSILIHSGTGGIGLAAINICSHYKCNIFITVGTKEKRQFLKKHFPHIPDEHIGNSRDTSFEQMIEKQTNGRGVDIVLNSLAEEKLLASVRCLAKGGHFVEIGKFDVAKNSPLSLLLMKKEASFHGVMLDTFFIEASEIKQKLMNEVIKGINLGYIKALPTTIFKRSEVREAFKYMTTGKHIGKVLVKIRDNENDTRTNIIKGVPRVICDNFKSYIIIGGLGGFGLELANWLVIKGARKLILSSRQGIKNGYQLKRIKVWESYGVAVHISTSDVTTREGCLQLIQEAKRLGQIDGIFNLGVVLKDAEFENQTEECFNISFGPKAFATKFLDDITRTSCSDLRYFVVFSSISCGRGNAGQTNYGMSNSVMERICENRRTDGLPGLAIEWGAIGDVGLVAQLAKNNVELEIRGTLQQRISNCLETLDRLLNQTEAAIVSSMVVAEKKKRYGSGTAADAILEVLGIKDVNTVSRHATLAELGMDSITATEIVQVLETDFEINLTAKELRSMTLDQLIEAEKIRNKVPDNESNDSPNPLGKILPNTEISEIPISRLISKIEEDSANAAVAFILPGFEGHLEPLERLTKNLKCVIFGLKYAYANPEFSLEQMANCFIPSIEEQLSSNKNFNLICYSFGAVLCMEIAHILESKGCLGRIYSVEGGYDYFHKYVKEHSKEDIETQVIIELMALFMPLDDLLPQKDKLKTMETFEERLDYAASIVPEKMRKSENLAKQEIKFALKRIMCGYSYKFTHEKLKSSVYLFKASNPLPVQIENDYGWSKYCMGEIKIETVEGSHTTNLENPTLHFKINDLLQW